MEILLNLKFTEMLKGNTADLKEFFVHYCRFYKEMTYDTVSFETCITEILPDNGAIMGATPRFDTLRQCLPKGMKAVGGVGNGIFEISEDLVGFEYLAYMMADDPDLFADLYRRIGDLLSEIWKEFLMQYSDVFIIFRF